MTLQHIKSTDGRDEYVLLPIDTYQLFKKQIDKALDEEYVSFELEDFVQNSVALERIRAGLTQEELAERLEVSQAYISKIENQSTVPPKLINRIKKLFQEKESKRT